MVHGYHVILAAYGFWLPNDPRGSWSDSGSWLASDGRLVRRLVVDWSSSLPMNCNNAMPRGKRSSTRRCNSPENRHP